MVNALRLLYLLRSGQLIKWEQEENLSVEQKASVVLFVSPPVLGVAKSALAMTSADPGCRVLQAASGTVP